MPYRFSSLCTHAFLRLDRKRFTLFSLATLFVLLHLLNTPMAAAQTRPYIQWMHGGHPLGLKQAVLSQDGKTLATIGFDATIKLRRTLDGTLIRTIFDSNGQLNAIALSPDGTEVVSASTANLPLHIYRLSDGTLLQSWNGFAGVSALAWSPDGSKVALGTQGQGVVQILNAADGSVFTTMTGHTAAVRSVAFSPDGTHLVSGSVDKTVRVWNVANGSLLQTFKSHTDQVTAVAFSADNRTIASASLDGTVKLWDSVAGTQLQSLVTGVPNFSVAFSPSGSVLATGSQDAQTRIWNVATGSLLHSSVLGPVATPIASLLYSPDGSQLLAAGQLLEFTFYNSSDLSQVRSLPLEHTAAVTTVGVTPDGAHVVSVAEDDGHLHVWNRTSGVSELAIANDAAGGVSLHNYFALAMSPDSKAFATTDQASLLRIRRISDGSITLEKNIGTQSDAIAWSRDGQRLFHGISASNGIAIRSVVDGSLVGTLLGHTDQILALAVSPDGRLLASSSMDQTIKIWRLSDSKLLSTFTGHTDWVDSVAFSPDSSKLLSGSYDSSAILWNVADGTILHTFPSDAAVTSVAIAPDGLTVATASQKHLRLWSLSDDSLLNDYTDEVNFTIHPLTNASTMLTYSPDNVNIIYSRLDATVVVVANPYGPPTVALSLSPASVISGASTTGTITLNHPALSGGAAIDLQSDNGLAALSTYRLTIPAGASTSTFSIRTSVTPITATATITVGNSVSASAAILTILPHLSSDFNNDGLTDLVFQNQSTNLIVIWYTSVLNVIGGDRVSQVPPSGWKVVGASDFNGDGNSDLMIQNQTTGKVYLMYMIGTTVGGGEEISFQLTPDYQVVGVADFNNDGHPDVLYQQQGTGHLAVLFLNGATVIGTASIPQAPLAGYNVVGVGDFNSDGKPDILFQNQTTNQLSVWFMNGVQYVSQGSISGVPDAGYQVHAVTDMNGDGKPDLVFQNQTTNRLVVWFLNGLTYIGGGPMSGVPDPGFKLLGPH